MKNHQTILYFGIYILNVLGIFLIKQAQGRPTCFSTFNSIAKCAVLTHWYRQWGGFFVCESWNHISRGQPCFVNLRISLVLQSYLLSTLSSFFIRMILLKDSKDIVGFNELSMTGLSTRDVELSLSKLNTLNSSLVFSLKTKHSANHWSIH